MAIITKAIKLETTQQNLIQAVIAKQNDCNSRFLKVTFLNEGTIIPLDSSSDVTINAERKDGSSKSFFGVVNDDDTATVPLHSWILELDGEVSCDISIIGSDSRLTTTGFVVKVEKAANSGDDISSDPQYDVLINLIDEVNEANQNTSQGRSAKYNFTTPGWKRILNIIRATNGSIDIGLASGQPYRMVQALAFDFSGFVKYPTDTADSKPVLIKRYENTFGQDDAVKNHPFKVSKIRIGYPKAGTDFPETDGTTNYKVNPVNCYVDIYIDFLPGETTVLDENLLGEDGHDVLERNFKNGSGLYTVKTFERTDSDVENDSYVDVTFTDGSYYQLYDYSNDYKTLSAGTILQYDAEKSRLYEVESTGDYKYISFNMNYAGFSNSHNCTAITEETNATDTGIYGEELTYYTVDVEDMAYFVSSEQIYSGSAAGYGIKMHANGFLSIDQASNGEIDKGTNKYKPISAANVKYAVENVLKEHGLI